MNDGKLTFAQYQEPTLTVGPRPAAPAVLLNGRGLVDRHVPTARLRIVRRGGETPDEPFINVLQQLFVSSVQGDEAEWRDVPTVES